MELPLSIVSFYAFEPGVIALFALMLVLLAVSALMSGSETALFSLTPSDMDTVRKSNSHGDKSIITLLTHQDNMLATILIVNNLVNICIILIANRIIDRTVMFNNQGWEFAIKTIVVTFLLLLFGEIMPKVYSAYNSLRFARLVSSPLVLLVKLFRPFSFLLIKGGGVMNNLLGKKRAGISIDELSNAIEITKDQSEEERRLLSGIVEFVNTDVEQVMRPRIDMVTLGMGDSFEKVKEVIVRSGFSRIPVWEDSIDNIRGVLYVKDVLAFLDREAAFGWQSLIRKTYFVPVHKKINELLEEFRSMKIHLAIVVDEYGSTVGLVSLEDILEEIVGEITDETDMVDTSGFQRIDHNTYLFDGKTHLNDMLKALDMDDNYLDDVRGHAETVAGLLLELKRDFVRHGESFAVRDLHFTVRTVEGRRIDKVTVKTGK